MVERVKTGIRGLDGLMGGGIPEGSNILVTGAPGTGKTILGIQYLYNGASSGEPGLYITLDTRKDELFEQGKMLGMDVEALEKAGKLMVLEVPLDTAGLNIFESIEGAIKKMGAKRVVFDSLINFSINVDQFVIPLNYMIDVAPDKKDKMFYSGRSKERITYLLINELSKLGTTNLIITASDQDGTVVTKDGVSEFAADGLIILRASAMGDTLNRTIQVAKMRKTRIEGEIKSYEIGDNGIALQG